MKVSWFKWFREPFWGDSDCVKVEGDFVGIINGIFNSYFLVRMKDGKIEQVKISKARLSDGKVQ